MVSIESSSKEVAVASLRAQNVQVSSIPPMKRARRRRSARASDAFSWACSSWAPFAQQKASVGAWQVEAAPMAVAVVLGLVGLWLLARGVRA